MHGAPEIIAQAASQATIEARNTWQKCQNRLRAQIPEPFFSTFIAPVEMVANDSSLCLLAPDAATLQHIRRNYFGLIQNSLSLPVDLQIRGQRSLFARSPQTPEPFFEDELEYICAPEQKTLLESLCQRSFSGTVVFIEGPTGSGKSTLARTIAKRNYRHYRMEDFFSDFARACQNKDILPWRGKVRQNDLIIDDFQFMKRSAQKTQEELCNLIDDFKNRGQRLVLLSDRPMPQLAMGPALQSRVGTALHFLLPYPNTAARLAILKALSSSPHRQASAEELEFLAGHLSGDGRQLEGALVRLNAPGATSSRDARLKSLLSDFKPRALAPELILECVANFSGLSIEAIQGPARERKYSTARHTAAYLMQEFCSLTLQQIARQIGRKDHGAVLHARHKIEKLMRTDLFFSSQIERIKLDLMARVC